MLFQELIHLNVIMYYARGTPVGMVPCPRMPKINLASFAYSVSNRGDAMSRAFDLIRGDASKNSFSIILIEIITAILTVVILIVIATIIIKRPVPG